MQLIPLDITMITSVRGGGFRRGSARRRSGHAPPMRRPESSPGRTARPAVHPFAPCARRGGLLMAREQGEHAGDGAVPDAPRPGDEPGPSAAELAAPRDQREADADGEVLRGQRAVGLRGLVGRRRRPVARQTGGCGRTGCSDAPPRPASSSAAALDEMQRHVDAAETPAAVTIRRCREPIVGAHVDVHRRVELGQRSSRPPRWSPGGAAAARPWPAPVSRCTRS